MMRLMIAVFGFVLAGGIFFLYTKPHYDDIKIAQTQIREYNAALDKAAELQQRKQELLSKYNAFNPTDIDRLQKLLPDHVDNVRLILDLDNLAVRYGLGLQNVDVSKVASQGAKSQTSIGAIGASNQKYDSVTLTFSTKGTYENFTKFLADLESDLRIVDLVTLSISGASSDTQSAGSARIASASQYVYTYNITLRAYWLK